jgi:hypothetical protein
MHLPGCIFIVGMTILGTFSVTIKQKDQDRCLEGYGQHYVKVTKCVPNSPSQNWTVDGDHFKNQKLQLYLADEVVSEEILQPCEHTPSANGDKEKDKKLTNARKIRIEGHHFKNYKNHCLRFELKRASFTDCNNPEMKEAVVV